MRRCKAAPTFIFRTLGVRVDDEQRGETTDTETHQYHDERIIAHVLSLVFFVVMGHLLWNLRSVRMAMRTPTRMTWNKGNVNVGIVAENGRTDHNG